MRKHKLSYASVTVSKSYLDAYNAAFNASASNWTEANNAMHALMEFVERNNSMQAIDVAWEEIALNAELWTEYKQVGAEAEALLNSNLYSEDAKAFLRAYYVQVYQKRLSELELSNEQLPDAIQELRDYMELLSTGEWTGISLIPEVNGQFSMVNGQWTLDGKPVINPKQSGLYIKRGSDGRFRKVVR